MSERLEANKITRREIFAKLIGQKSQSSLSEQSAVDSLHTPVSRRSALLSLGMFANGILIDRFIKRDATTDRRTASVSPVDKRDLSILDTSVQTMALLGLELTALSLTDRVGLTNSHDSEETIFPNPSAYIFKSTVLPGIIEEYVFRLIPNCVFATNRPGYAWNVGIPSAIVFALMHNFNEAKSWKDLRFDFAKFPLTQFMSGLFLHKLFREKNYSHAVFSHALHNGLVIALFEAKRGMQEINHKSIATNDKSPQG